MGNTVNTFIFAALVLSATACSATGGNNGGGPGGDSFGGMNQGFPGGGGGAGTPSGTAGTGSQPVGGALPCAVDALVKAHCQTCHGARPIGGAPMSLVTEADFQADYQPHTTTALMGQTLKVYQLARIRINGSMGTMKMPQGNPLAPNDFTTLDSWLASGAPAGAACGPPPGGNGGFTGTGSAPGTGSIPGYGGTIVGTGSAPGYGGTIIGSGSSTSMAGSGAGAGAPPGAGGAISGPPHEIISATTTDVCATDPTTFQALVARPGETCYEFPVHGQSSPTDKSKFSIPVGQTYNQFYYKIPWPAGTLATRFGAKFDNLAVLHHWLAFGISSGTQAEGTVQTNVSGTTLGQGAELIGGWAIGGCESDFGPEMGLKLPASGQIMIQWHHYNSTNGPAPDGTVIQFCTVPAGGRPNIGGITFLGTENLNGPVGMPAHQVSKFSGTCTNNSGKPIIIKGYSPHMHLLGVNMNSVVKHTNGMMETVFDHPFLFDHQVNYSLPNGYQLLPGESITSTCTFNNTTDGAVAFGQPTQKEMCYQFTYSYPYGALNNGVISLIGATNTCW
jgi:hypothetical protein